MQASTISLLLCLLPIAYGFPETQIVGGKDAPVGMFPYQVSLRIRGDHFCGGSIVNSRYILTAAHCVWGSSHPKLQKVHVGTNLLSSTGEIYEMENIIIHRDFNGATRVNDIALIRVDRDIAFNDLVKAISLATGNNTFEGSSCILSGWGAFKESGETKNQLQYINLLVDNQSHCKKKHIEVTDTHICTFTKYSEGACYGDSGGPLVANGVQIGIVSFGEPCGVGYPDVYTRVSSFNSWIQQQQTYIENGQHGEVPENAIYIL